MEKEFKKHFCKLLKDVADTKNMCTEMGRIKKKAELLKSENDRNKANIKNQLVENQELKKSCTNCCRSIQPKK